MALPSIFSEVLLKTASKVVEHERQGFINSGGMLNSGGVSNNGLGPATGYYCMPFYTNGKMKPFILKCY